MANLWFFIKRYRKGLIIVSVYVDNRLFVGHMEALNIFLTMWRSKQGLLVEVYDSL